MHESYLPLLPLPIDLSSLSFATNDLPRTCSVSALRGSFTPIPFRLPSHFAPVRSLKRSRNEGDIEERVGKVRVAQEAGRVPVPPPVFGESKRPESALTMREMRRSDVEAVKLLQDVYLPLVYPPSFYTFLLTTHGFLCLLAYSLPSPSSPPTLIGLAAARLINADTIYLLSLLTIPTSRNSGVARSLLKGVSTNLTGKQDAIFQLHVYEKNEGARKFYKGCGMVEGRVARGYYRGLGDGVEMKGRLNY